MLKYLLISIFCILLFLNCSGEQQKEENSDAQVETIADAKECAGGCGMAMDKEKMIAVEEDGDTLYFCSEKCQEKYMAKEKSEDSGESEDNDEI